MKELPKACVILGAGASHDVHGEGSRIKNPAYKPPLTRDLFNTAANEAYLDVLERYPDAQFLTQRLAALVKFDEISIEKELMRYSNHDNPKIRSQFKHIPGYLRDLLYLSSTQYTSIPSSYVELAQELLLENPHDVLFISLNYDNLLESAITRIYPELLFRDISQYISNDRHLKVVKLHGSINWFKLMTNDGKKNWYDAVSRFDISKQVHESNISVHPGISSVCAERGYNLYWLYPILTAPLASKDISNAVCPESHITAAKEFLSTCQKFLAIGTSGLDDDLLGIINSCLTDSMILYHIHIVGFENGADDCSTRFQKGVKVFRRSISNENVFRKGFRHYLHNDLRSFIEWGM